MSDFEEHETSTASYAEMGYWAAALSFAILLPLAVIDLVFSSQESSKVDMIFVWAMMWFLTMLIVLVLSSLLAVLQSSDRPEAWLAIVTQMLLLLILTFAWSEIMMDQLPCFLGQPNCD